LPEEVWHGIFQLNLNVPHGGGFPAASIEVDSLSRKIAAVPADNLTPGVSARQKQNL
jgi:hypothetical protein